jgi:hypothetical protein
MMPVIGRNVADADDDPMEPVSIEELATGRPAALPLDDVIFLFPASPG